MDNEIVVQKSLFLKKVLKISRFSFVTVTVSFQKKRRKNDTVNFSTFFVPKIVVQDNDGFFVYVSPRLCIPPTKQHIYSCTSH